jgi:hypothetical protein
MIEQQGDPGGGSLVLKTLERTANLLTVLFLLGMLPDFWRKDSGHRVESFLIGIGLIGVCFGFFLWALKAKPARGLWWLVGLVAFLVIGFLVAWRAGFSVLLVAAGFSFPVGVLLGFSEAKGLLAAYQTVRRANRSK